MPRERSFRQPSSIWGYASLRGSRPPCSLEGHESSPSLSCGFFLFSRLSLQKASHCSFRALRDTPPPQKQRKQKSSYFKVMVLRGGSVASQGTLGRVWRYFLVIPARGNRRRLTSPRSPCWLFNILKCMGHPQPEWPWGPGGQPRGVSASSHLLAFAFPE